VLALTGNLGYFVNRDAVRFFLGQVWPALRRARPEVRLWIAGARAAGLSSEAAAAGAELVADPQDLRGLVASASVAIAPLRCGAGVPVKVLEAWAVGTPVVASSWAAAGTTAIPERDLLVADEPSEWLRQIGRLLDDEALRSRLAASGREVLERHHGEEATASAMRSWANAATAVGPR
jgi:glycosyltransferase involved in cell wall biosynthesis